MQVAASSPYDLVDKVAARTDSLERASRTVSLESAAIISDDESLRPRESSVDSLTHAAEFHDALIVATRVNRYLESESFFDEIR
jgi:hypothetical protein